MSNKHRSRRHRGRGQPRGKAPYQPPPKTSAIKRNTLRIIPLGGNEEVGRNSTVFEYNDTIVIVDLGLQFPEEDMPGIDYIIPNTTYLRGKETKIKGIIITHGHYDHIGGIPHLAHRLGNPPIYGTPLTLGIIRKRQDDFRDSPKPNLRVVQRDTMLRLGEFRVEFFGLSHNIPDSVGVVIRTPVGTVIHTGDFKLDPNERAENVTEMGKITQYGRQQILMLMADSTNASKPGRQLTEGEIEKNVEQIIRQAKGRLIIGTFSSLISRLSQIIKIAEGLGKKIVIEGYSMRTNLEIARELGYIRYHKDTVVPVQQMHRYPKNKLVILCTGAQGEGRAVLMRVANREHRFIRIEPGDTVLFSSSVVPGNERAVQRLTDGLYKEGAEVINYQMMDVHAGGHALQEDLKDMHRLVKPRYLMPIEGNYSFLKLHEKAAIEGGFSPKNVIVAGNGQIVECTKQGCVLTKERAVTDYVFVDGLGVGDVSHIVLRDRQQLAGDGMVVVIATIEEKTGRLVGTPEVITRGFVYVKENFKLIKQIQEKTKKILVDKDPKIPANDADLRNKIRDQIGQFLFTKTERRPLILPVIVQV
ncbi:MAG: ribonuclease J [Candidatus Kerfeldbacteria bacterium]|nr:ribonuclease J [Candidatus Kerfeldbacteria bacterium]